MQAFKSRIETRENDGLQVDLIATTVLRRADVNVGN
jgi:hypothetical protein